MSKQRAEPCAADPFERVCRAMSRVDRAAFVPSNLRPYADTDAALPIGHGKTISKPSTLAFILSTLDIQPGEQVLEVGSGSGYLLAVLAELGARVHGIERIPQLAQSARRRLDRLGYPGVVLRFGNGLGGWADYSPFDVIILSAAVKDAVPRALLEQLSDRGRLLAPVASIGRENDVSQRFELWSTVVDEAGQRRHVGEVLGPCEFVLAD